MMSSGDQNLKKSYPIQRLVHSPEITDVDPSPSLYMVGSHHDNAIWSATLPESASRKNVSDVNYQNSAALSPPRSALANTNRASATARGAKN